MYLSIISLVKKYYSRSLRSLKLSGKTDRFSSPEPTDTELSINFCLRIRSSIDSYFSPGEAANSSLLTLYYVVSFDSSVETISIK